jgi:hypothetical protein
MVHIKLIDMTIKKGLENFMGKLNIRKIINLNRYQDKNHKQPAAAIIIPQNKQNFKVQQPTNRITSLKYLKIPSIPKTINTNQEKYHFNTKPPITHNLFLIRYNQT